MQDTARRQGRPDVTHTSFKSGWLERTETSMKSRPNEARCSGFAYSLQNGKREYKISPVFSAILCEDYNNIKSVGEGERAALNV